MRESKFVEQNKEKWEHIEEDLKSGISDPSVLRSHLIHVTDDLSYARTFYQNRSVRIYMNSLAQKLYIRIIKNRSDFLKATLRFFSEEVPLIMYHSRKQLGIAFLLLVLSFSIGFFSAARDPEFVNSILSDSYVEMTKKNIQAGDPMAVYKQSAPFEMFIRIAYNNLQVSVTLFALGLLASYGTIVMLFYNGIMLGAFYHFFASKGLSATFNFTVWMHGAIEISSIVIVSVAGLLLGKGLIQPGSYSRIKAFNIWGRRGAMILLSVFPFIVIAAVVESFLTRHTEYSNFFRAAFILISFSAMFGYFFLFPYLKYRNKQVDEMPVPDLRPENETAFDQTSVYSAGLLFVRSINIFTANFNRIILFSLVTGLVLSGAYYYVYDLENEALVFISNINVVELIVEIITMRNNFLEGLSSNIRLLFNKYEMLTVYLVSSAWLTVVIAYALNSLSLKVKGQSIKASAIPLAILPMVLLLNLFFLVDSKLLAFVAVLLSAFVIPAIVGKYMMGKKQSFFSLVMMMFSSGFLRLAGRVLMMFFIMMLGMMVVLSPLVFFALQFINVNVTLDYDQLTSLTNLVILFFSGTMVTMIIVFYVYECGLNFFSIYEINTAEGLIERIDHIGRSKKAYGIETE